MEAKAKAIEACGIRVGRAMCVFAIGRAKKLMRCDGCGGCVGSGGGGRRSEADWSDGDAGRLSAAAWSCLDGTDGPTAAGAQFSSNVAQSALIFGG
jgi:hypothetical protein